MASGKSSRGFTSEDPPSPLIGALLRMPWEVVQRRMLERLHEHGFGDLDVPHLNVLRYPGPEGARPSELAARLGMTKQALNYLLGELERLGYLERRPDQDDARSRRIALTERGWALVPVIRDAVADVERDWARALGAKRFAQLRTLLVELNRVV
jgi:DNA-binding MarR family transcriptional regulator